MARRLPGEVIAVSATSPVALRNVVVCLGLVAGSTTVETCDGGKDPGRGEMWAGGTDPGATAFTAARFGRQTGLPRGRVEE
jgi:hypothetical protein